MGNIKEPVRIRLKDLKNGNKSIYLDCYMGNGNREYKFLKLYLHPEKSKEDKAWNREQIRLANAIKSRYIIQLQNGEYGFKDRSQLAKQNFIDYCMNMVETYRDKGQKSCATLLECAVKRLIRYKGRNISFAQIDKEYLSGFIDFLNQDCTDFDRKTTKKDKKTISNEYKVVLYARIMTALNKAERDGIITKNPGKDIERGIKPRSNPKGRCFLTIQEIQSIIKTPYSRQNDIKNAFLFCCFCGLRYSDVRKLTWGELKEGPDGRKHLETKMKKTGQELYLPLSDNAIRWLPQRPETSEVKADPDDERIFRHLPAQACHANRPLRTLMRKAGISKHVTFHVARHTFATLALTYGADLYTVSKLLGHTTVQTTQIYAKVVDESKRKAVDMIPEV